MLLLSKTHFICFCRSQKEREIRNKLKKGDLSGISEEMLNALPPTFFKQPKATEGIFIMFFFVKQHDHLNINLEVVYFSTILKDFLTPTLASTLFSRGQPLSICTETTKSRKYSIGMGVETMCK